MTGFEILLPTSHPHMGQTLNLVHGSDGLASDRTIRLFGCAVADHNDLVALHPGARLDEQFAEFGAGACRDGAVLLIDGATEGWSFSAAIAEGLHACLERHSIPARQVVLVTTNHLFEEDYRAWARGRGTSPISIFVYDFWAYKMAQELVLQAGSIEAALARVAPEPKVDKILLSYNRIFKAHRAAVVLALQAAGQLANCHISFMADSPSLSDQDAAAKGAYLASLGWNSLTPLLSGWPELAAKVPLTADKTSVDEYLTFVFGTVADEIYDRVGFTVITESDFGVSRVDRVTEKPFKAIANFCPFVLVGQAGQIQRLRTMGFEIDSIFDHGYDAIEDSDRRLGACLDIIATASRRTLTDLAEARRADRDRAMRDYRTLVRFASPGAIHDLAGRLRGAILALDETNAA